MKIYVDATNIPVGRLGSYVAKNALNGNEVIVLNSEKAIISGNKKDILEKILNWRSKGGSSLKGPIVPKSPERLLKRMIRGMLPWDKKRGKEAYKRIKCFKSGELKVEEKEITKLKVNLPLKFVELKEICKLI
ncbi:MAG: 50S ribosomal protein L13 [Candidatus Pacearchaeota archaeon]